MIFFIVRHNHTDFYIRECFYNLMLRNYTLSPYTIKNELMYFKLYCTLLFIHSNDIVEYI